MKEKNIALCIILSMVTCGIYGLIWYANMTDDINSVANPPKQTSGGMVVLLTIITCNIYGLYWAYNSGALLDQALAQRGQPPQNRSVIYLILQLVFPIATWALIQNTLNSMATN